MSTLTPEAAAVSTAPSGTDRVRAALVSAILTLGAVAVAVIVLWQPWGERDALSYADIQPHRDAAWLGTLVDGLAIAAIGVTLGLAVCRLVPGPASPGLRSAGSAATGATREGGASSGRGTRASASNPPRARGAALATIGAVMTGFGGVAFAAGMISFGSFAWYATDPAAVPPDAGDALMTYVVDNPGHLMATQMAGFLLYTLGSLLLMGALWRARAVPRWLPIAYLVLTVGLFVLGGVVMNIVQAVQTLLLVPVALYALRR